ncbi:hypothetical protein EL17_01640 [Anditalea andensis]|uniref:DUF2200 domain-containing protein n=2 Tax=Anditalea andensis TaxID=1048983 RepID=A0A074L605_9BACT|nr:hypothetical protein EL17_01640 [Anditalea andensis]
MANMTFASVYPHYVSKIERKGRTKDELHQIITWLTGYDEKKVQDQVAKCVTFQQFFEEAQLNEHAHLITGSICGYKIQEIQNPITKKVRYLDKIVDELAKGRQLDKIMRNGNT